MTPTAVSTHEPPWCVASCLEVDVASQGETIEAAIDNLNEARALYAGHPAGRAPASPAIIATVELGG